MGVMFLVSSLFRLVSVLEKWIVFMKLLKLIRMLI